MIISKIIYFVTISLTLLLFSLVPRVRCDKGFFLGNLLKVFVSSFIVSYPLFLLLASRYDIGTDYENYEKLYTYYIQSGITGFEPFFASLFWVGDNYNLNFDSFIVFTSFICIVIPFGYIKNSFLKKDVFLAVFTLIVLLFGSWFNIIRQCTAMGIILIAIHYLIERKIIGYLFFILLASLCHSSSLVLLPCVFFIRIFNKSMSKVKVIKHLSFLGIICILLVFLYLRFGANLAYYDHVAGEEADGITSKWFLIFSAFLYAPEFLLLKYILKEDNKYSILYALLILEFTCYLFGLYMNLGYRIGQLFSLVHVYLLPRVVCCAQRHKIKFLKPYIYSLLVVFFYFTTFIAKYNGVYNYKYKISIFKELFPII